MVTHVGRLAAAVVRADGAVADFPVVEVSLAAVDFPVAAAVLAEAELEVDGSYARARFHNPGS